VRSVPRFVAASVLVAAIAAGCRTPPDLAPFTDATSQLAGSIKASGRVTCDEIDAVASDWPPPQLAAAKKVKDDFRREWTERDALADALLDYSASLAAIVAAGDQGAQSAANVGDAFKKLTDAVDVALPPGTLKVFDASLHLGEYLYGKYAKDRAAATLGESMRNMQPAIDETARVLGESLRQIETGLDALRDQAAQNVEDEPAGGGFTVSTERDALKKLIARRHALVASLAREPQAPAAVADLAAVDAGIKSQTELLAPFDAKKAADRTRLSEEMRLARTAREGLVEWAAAHGRLADAALAKRAPNVDELMQTVMDIRGMIKDIRDARRE